MVIVTNNVIQLMLQCQYYSNSNNYIYFVVWIVWWMLQCSVQFTKNAATLQLSNWTRTQALVAAYCTNLSIVTLALSQVANDYF